MDPISEIKARLPIEQLVSQYCQLIKKGKNFKAICPFHSDKDPSLLVSPDKGIAYCFSCQTGGDIFSFYQKIEGVDFPQAIKDLAEKCGVQIAHSDFSGPKKDEKDRARECLEETMLFYQKNLKGSKDVLEYLDSRGVTEKEIQEFQLGVAPDSFSKTYEYLLKAGYSKNDIVLAGLAVQKDLDGKMYDYFRGRLMIPIHNRDGKIIGFGGRTLKNDDAKYINSPDSVFYRKSQALFSVHRAKETMRDTKEVFLVEGYFDVMACWRLGVMNTVAQCGTALTDEHVRVLKRSVGTVVFALDQDRAGKEAAERAFVLCAKEGLQVRSIPFQKKDPADLAQSDPTLLQNIFSDSGIAYLDLVIQEVSENGLRSVEEKRRALDRLLPLISSLSTSVERDHYIKEGARVFGVTEMTLKEDFLAQHQSAAAVSHRIDTTLDAGSHVMPKTLEKKNGEQFSKIEVALGLLLLYPKHHHLLKEIIPPEEDGFAKVMYTGIAEKSGIPEKYAERSSILQIYCEEHGFADWSEMMAIREMRRNIFNANRETLKKKQEQLSNALFEARLHKRGADEKHLEVQYQELIKLSRIAR